MRSREYVRGWLKRGFLRESESCEDIAIGFVQESAVFSVVSKSHGQ